MSVVTEAQLDDVPAGKHVLCTLDRTGDTRIIWDPENEEEVENARRTFNELREKRFVAYAVRAGGGKGEVIRQFDPEAEKLILAPPLVGG